MAFEAALVRVARAAERAGRPPGAVRVVAVTKGRPVERVREAAAAGLCDIGESRVAEALSKQEALGDLDVRWHLVGHLQRNKAKLAAGRFALIHSLDSIRLADALEAACARAGVVQPVLVQVNVAREDQKSGVAPEEAAALIQHAATQPHLAVRGCMTIAPLTDDVDRIRRTFAGLSTLRDSLAWRGLDLRELSMGMSNDFEIAVEEGATLLRLGTVLFGE